MNPISARLRPNKNCGCSLEHAFFLLALWSLYHARQTRPVA